jgi:hypothetical protein
VTAAASSPVRAVPATKRDELVARLNTEYALILLGERPAVLREGAGSDGRPEFRLLSVAGFHEWLRPTYLWERDDSTGQTRKLQASKIWVDSEKRRQYEGLVFDPSDTSPAGYYNLWRGFAVEPSSKGSCQRFLDHIAENVCRGDEYHFSWVIAWFAAMVQEPIKKGGTSLVLRGAQGTGKTILGKIFGSLLGPHYALVADSRYIVGRFNAHLANCLLLQLDEATWGGDHAAAGKLKDLITGDYQYIEYKGKEPVKVKNYVRLLVTGNNNWLVPAGLEERRFAVFDMGDERRQDNVYFGAIEAEIENGGRARLLDYLLTFDLESVRGRNQVPPTAALAEQQVASLAPEQQWWLDVLRRGALPGDEEGRGETPTHTLYENYLDRMQRVGVNRKHSETGFGIALRRMVPGISRVRRTIVSILAGTDRFWAYALPPLDVCRNEFGRITGDADRSDDSPDQSEDGPSNWQPWRTKS